MDLRPHHDDHTAANSAAADSADIIFDFPGMKSNTVAKLLQAGCKLYVMYVLESSNKRIQLPACVVLSPCRIEPRCAAAHTSDVLLRVDAASQSTLFSFDHQHDAAMSLSLHLLLPHRHLSLHLLLPHRHLSLHLLLPHRHYFCRPIIPLAHSTATTPSKIDVQSKTSPQKRATSSPASSLSSRVTASSLSSRVNASAHQVVAAVASCCRCVSRVLLLQEFVLCQSFCDASLPAHLYTLQPMQSSGSAALDDARARFLRALQDKEQRAHSLQASPMKPINVAASPAVDVVEVHDVPILASSTSGQTSGSFLDAASRAAAGEGGGNGGGLSVAAELLYGNRVDRRDSPQ